MSLLHDLHTLYDTGTEGEEQRPVERGERFKLLWLPVLARNEVFRSMDIKERITLSVCSRRTEGMIRYTKKKVNKIEFHVNINNSFIQIESLHSYMYNCNPDQQTEGSYNIGAQILSGWIEKNSTSFQNYIVGLLGLNWIFRNDENYTSFQNCVSVFKHLQNITSFNSLCLHVNLEGMTAQFFKEILTEPALKDFELLSLDEGKIDAESLDLVMEMAQSNRVLRIKWTEIPKGYYHKNALKFRDINYWDARWVRIENLLTLKDSSSVELGWNKLTCSDMNTFIKYWIESEHDMVQSLSSRTSMAFQTEHLFDGIVALKARFAIYLVVANPTKQRKRPILSITCYDDGMIYMKSYDKDDTFCLWGSLKVESWAPEYKVLQALNKKKELEGKLKEIQKLLDTNQDKNMIEKKNDISRELRNVSTELDRYNLVLWEGVFLRNRFM